MNPRVSPLDPLIDLRMLALFSSLQLGASALFLQGLAFHAAVLLVACALLRCCCAWRRRRAGSAEEPDDFASDLEQRRDDALRALEVIEADLAKERAGCFGRPRRRNDNGPWG